MREKEETANMKQKLTAKTKKFESDWDCTFAQFANIDALTNQRNREYERLKVQVSRREQFSKQAMAVSKIFNDMGLKNADRLKSFEHTMELADHQQKLSESHFQVT